MNINHNTKKYGLIGYPISKTLSPYIHNTFYKYKNLNNIYLPFEVEENLSKVVGSLKTLKIHGYNVTIPYKNKIIEFLDEIDGEAKQINAVNTVKLIDNKLIGYNTDGIGFMKSLERNNIALNNKNILLIGSGGASYSIGNSLLKEDINTLYIANRTYENAKRLVENLNKNYKNQKIVITDLELNDVNKNAIDIVINTSSMGMYPKINQSPIELDGFKDIVLYDIIYKPLKTRLLKEGEKKGFKSINGLEMLLYQGIESQKIWLDIEISALDEEYMYNSLYNYIKAGE